jgi:hypothetical protein
LKSLDEGEIDRGPQHGSQVLGQRRRQGGSGQLGFFAGEQLSDPGGYWELGQATSEAGTEVHRGDRAEDRYGEESSRPGHGVVDARGQARALLPNCPHDGRRQRGDTHRHPDTQQHDPGE